ncbi:hypothetical protein EZV62_017659 [Acer yangbiense]|uniref:EamA domain-containing protein n=1 Tax=Acer yangbiense TaxID=1000413 RepID=A0A5C7HJG9_9ROSI|nr:hypothetical protein EZV62_017659 [Acer yangbiense]
MVVCSTGKDLFPFMGMVIVILAQVSNMEVMKAAMSKGINKYVIIVYSDALSTFIFLISSLFIYRSNLPPITFSVLSRFFLLSVFGMEKLSWSSKISQAKSLGTIVSIAGAFVVTFYKGPIILTALSGTASSRNYPLLSQQSNWILGGFFLAAESFFISAYYILQALILKKFPAVLIVMFFLFFFDTILATLFSLIVVRDSSDWKLRLDMELAVVLYPAIIGTGMRAWLCTWCLSRTGPVYISMFKPLAIVFSVVMGFIFLGDALCLGSTGKDLFPFMGMVIVILAQVSNMEVMKAAMSKGINKYVIIVYSDALSTFIFLISSLFIYRSNLPPITFSVLSRFFLLSVFGMEKLSWSSKISQAKSLGTIVSIAGAFVVTFYKGPIILTALSGTASSRNYPFLSQQSNWILGGFFLAAESFFISAWYIFQALMLKKFPTVLIGMFFLFFFDTILATLFSLIVVKDSSAWKLRFDMELAAVLYSAIIGTGMRVWLCTWCLSRTGPVYISMFKPLAIVFSVVMGFIFLGDALCLGSLIGAVTIVIGFYGVMWGKVKEQREVEQCELKKSSEKVPLLG